MAKAIIYSDEDVLAAQQALRSRTARKVGKTRSQVAEFLADDIRKAIEQIFGVKVLSVNTINVPGKATRGRTGRYGYTSDWKKAIIRLTEDSKTIELFEGMV